MNKTNLSLHPEYLKKEITLKKIKSDFQNWAAGLQADENMTLEKAMASIKEHEINIPRLVMHDFEYPLTLYRTRVIPGDWDGDLSNPQNFSYPPPKACGSFQRANAPGYPVFYGALDGQTATEELRINGEKIRENDTIFLSKWRIKKGVRSNFANLTLANIVEDHQLSAEMTKNVFREFTRIFKGEDDLFTKTQALLFQESSALFLMGSHIQSGTLAHEILYNTDEIKGIRIHGIMYPSVCNKFRSVNFALHPDFVDTALELESVQKFTFKEFTTNGCNGKVSYFGKLENGKVIWSTLYSEVMVHNFKIELALDSEWTPEEMKGSKCFLQGKEIDLRNYCAKLVDNIDLSKNSVKQEHLELFQNNTENFFYLDQNLDEGIAYLQHGEKINNIDKIRMTVPFLAGVKIVDPKQVLLTNL